MARPTQWCSRIQSRKKALNTVTHQRTTTLIRYLEIHTGSLITSGCVLCVCYVFFFTTGAKRCWRLLDRQDMLGPVVFLPLLPHHGRTLVGGLHVFLVEGQAVALHCSRVELQAEDHLALRRHVALVVAFDLLEKTNTTNKMVGGSVRVFSGDCWEVKRRCAGGIALRPR